MTRASIWIGNEKYRNDVKKDLKNKPMMMGNILVTYVVHVIHEKGFVESISPTIKAGTNGLISKCD